MVVVRPFQYPIPSAGSIFPQHYVAFGRPVTPTDCLSSECLSSSGESENEAVLPPSVPTRRDPALLVERLEKSKKRLGRAKRRRAANEAEFARLVDDVEVDKSQLFVKPYQSSFTKLHECPINMMVWYHFTNMSEEEQRLYLKKKGPLFKTRNRKLHNIEEEESGEEKQEEKVTDSRSLHPAAVDNVLPAVIRPVSATPSDQDDFLSGGIEEDYFSSPPVNKSDWNVDMVLTALTALKGLGGRRKLSVLDEKLSLTALQSPGALDVPFVDIMRFSSQLSVCCVELGKLTGSVNGSIKFKVATQAICDEITSMIEKKIGASSGMDSLFESTKNGKVWTPFPLLEEMSCLSLDEFEVTSSDEMSALDSSASSFDALEEL